MNETEDPKLVSELAGTYEELRALYGFDTDRKWATAVQVFIDKDTGHSIFVFRETIKVKEVQADGSEGEERNLLGKNVASIVMPSTVAAELREILDKLLKVANG